MERILDIRRKIYDYFQDTEPCIGFFIEPGNMERYTAYYTSIFLIKDTAESLWCHRDKGFSAENYLLSYIEIYGVLQALIIQQDSIRELYRAVNDQELTYSTLPDSWIKLRKTRNVCVGHPARVDRPRGEPLKRTFIRPEFGGYKFHYEQWEKPSNSQSTDSHNPLENISHPEVDLGELIDGYAVDAESILREILESMKEQWPI